MNQADALLTAWINSFAGRSAGVDSLMVLVTTWAIPVIVLLVAVQWWGPRPRPHTRHVLAAAGLAFLLGLALNQAVLLYVHRVRPYDAGITKLLIARSADTSFPSDHATAAFAVAAIFLLYGMGVRGALFLLAAIVVCVSRVYVGTHYVSDILGGALTGVVAAACVRLAYREGTRADRAITSIL